MYIDLYDSSQDADPYIGICKIKNNILYMHENRSHETMINTRNMFFINI